MARIDFTDKVPIQNNPPPNAVNYGMAVDFNEIKASVNKAYDAIEEDHVAWVSLTHGDDATGEIGRQYQPFATCMAAQDAASAGDLIVVLPGIHSLATLPLGKHGVNWLLLPGSTINGGTAGAIFTAPSGSAPCEYQVLGDGALERDNMANMAVLIANGTSAANIKIKCAEIRGAISMGTPTAGSVLSIECGLITGRVVRGGGDMSIRGNIDVQSDLFSNDYGVSVNNSVGGSFVLDGSLTYSAPNSLSNISTAAFRVYGNAEISIHNALIRSTHSTGILLSNETGTLHLDNVRVVSEGPVLRVPNGLDVSAYQTNSVGSSGLGEGGLGVDAAVVVVGDFHDINTSATDGDVAKMQANGTWRFVTP